MRTFSELKCPLANVYLYINYLSFIETQLTYKFVSVSVVQHSDSVFLQILPHFRWLEDNGCNSPCCTVSPWGLICFTYSNWCMNPMLLVCPSSPPLAATSLCVCEFVSVLHKCSLAQFLHSAWKRKGMGLIPGWGARSYMPQLRPGPGK